MSWKIKTTFELKSEPSNGGRIGVIHYGDNRKLVTPALFPAICIMTGPPGFGRQGAIYKYIKRDMCREWNPPFDHFLSEILHFSDFMHSREALNQWIGQDEKDEKPFQYWLDGMRKGGKDVKRDEKGDPIKDEDGKVHYPEHFQGHYGFDYKLKQKPYEACFFLDSGGFRLLGNSDFSIEKYGFKTSYRDIVQLQTRMGGDIIASLDYPLPPVEYDSHTLQQIQGKSIQNAIDLMKILSRRGRSEPKPLAYLAVHGIDYETAREYMERLFKPLDKMAGKYPSFGFAIGSLVPRRSNRGLVSSIVKGVKDAIREHKKGIYIDKPIHAFGVTGDLIPTMAYLGVDTFDSNSFVQGGKNMKFVFPHNRKQSATREACSLDELVERHLTDCGCRSCTRYVGHLSEFKRLSREKSNKRHDTKINGEDQQHIKSGVAAFLAMHNLEVELREIDDVSANIKKNRLDKYVIEFAENTSHPTKLIQAFEVASGKIVARQQERKVSLALSRESFAVPETDKPPRGKEILLLIPCTKDKPYRKSRSHQAIRAVLNKDPRIHIVTISGLYGPVPEEFEDEKEILQYDYMLSREAKDQMEFVTDRVTRYLKQYSNHYRQIIAYVTMKAYREVAKGAIKRHGKGLLLPVKPKEQTSKDFLRHENLAVLQQSVKLCLPDATFGADQMLFELTYT